MQITTAAGPAYGFPRTPSTSLAGRNNMHYTHAQTIEILAAHQWAIHRWMRGGYAWRCQCGVMDSGTAEENPERFATYATKLDASHAAATHLAAHLASAEQ